MATIVAFRFAPLRQGDLQIVLRNCSDNKSPFSFRLWRLRPDAPRLQVSSAEGGTEVYELSPGTYSFEVEMGKVTPQ